MVRLHRSFSVFLLFLLLGLTGPSPFSPPEALAGATKAGAEVPSPNRSDKGVFPGTWYYITRDGQMALWIRFVDGRPELKVRFRAKSTPEAFETGWDGKAAYLLAGYPATFAMELEEGDENTLAGRWQWDVEFRNSGRTERGKFILYRVGDGRHMMLRFSEYHKRTWKGEKVSTITSLPAWGFRKGSKRIVLWDELPF